MVVLVVGAAEVEVAAEDWVEGKQHAGGDWVSDPFFIKTMVQTSAQNQFPHLFLSGTAFY